MKVLEAVAFEWFELSPVTSRLKAIPAFMNFKNMIQLTVATRFKKRNTWKAIMQDKKATNLFSNTKITSGQNTTEKLQKV